MHSGVRAALPRRQLESLAFIWIPLLRPHCGSFCCNPIMQADLRTANSSGSPQAEELLPRL